MLMVVFVWLMSLHFVLIYRSPGPCIIIWYNVSIELKPCSCETYSSPGSLRLARHHNFATLVVEAIGTITL